ncbi:MAG: PA14 domain-containing protein [Phycisphaerae bacterium]|nr:PA14 domain-containing protein [Phycisphaerae bacterium]
MRYVTPAESRLSSRGRIRTWVRAIVAVSLISTFSQAALGRTTCQVKDDRIIVTLNIAFAGGSDKLIAKWAKEITDVWNGRLGYRKYDPCGCRIVFKVNTRRVKSCKPMLRGWHCMEVVPWKVGSIIFPELPDRAASEDVVAYMGPHDSRMKNGKIIITLPTGFVGTTQEAARKWAQSMESLWRGEKKDRYLKFKKPAGVQLVPKVFASKRDVPKGWMRAPAPPWSTLVGSHVHTPSGASALAYVGKTTWSPSIGGASLDGEWSTRVSRPVDPGNPDGPHILDAAHEAGHMMGLQERYDKKRRIFEDNIMGGTDPSHAKVAKSQPRLIVNNLTGVCWCPLCPPPSKRKPLEAVEVKGLAGGLRWAYYEGKFLSIPDTSRLKPVRSGRSKGFDLDSARRKDGCAMVFRGVIRVPADGCYTFILRSRDGSRFWVGGRVVADNDDWHKKVRTRVGKIVLRAGLHPIRLDYFERRRGAEFDIRWEGPGIKKQPIPAANLFSTDSGRPKNAGAPGS